MTLSLWPITLAMQSFGLRTVRFVAALALEYCAEKWQPFHTPNVRRTIPRSVFYRLWTSATTEAVCRVGGVLGTLALLWRGKSNFALTLCFQGFSTYAYPAVVVRHNRTPAARNPAKAARYYIRNQALLGFLYFPFSVLDFPCRELPVSPAESRMESSSGPAYCSDGWRHLSARSVGGICVVRCPWRSFFHGKSFLCLSNESRRSFLSVRSKVFPVWFMPLWCLVMPLTSFLLIPSVQGTIPAYMLAFVSAFFVILSRDGGQPSIQRTRYFTTSAPSGWDLASAPMRKPARTPLLEQARLWRYVTE